MGDLLAGGELASGLLAGTVAVLAVLALLGLRVVLRRPLLGRGTPDGGSGPVGLYGPALVVAGLLTIRGGLGARPIAPVPAGLAVGLGVLWLGGELSARAGRPAGPLLAMMAAAGGGALLATALGARTPGWVTILVVVGPGLGGAAAADLDRRGARTGLGPVLLAVALAATYTTVPDTELVRAMLGVALPLTLLAWPHPLVRLGSGGAYAAVGLVLWIDATEGVGRGGAVVGAAGALGLLVSEPLGYRLAASMRRARARLVRVRTPPRLAPAVAAQVLIGVYSARVAGLRHDAPEAAWLVVPALVAGVIAGVVAGAAPRRGPDRGGAGPARISTPGRRARPRERAAPRSPRPHGPPPPGRGRGTAEG